jgi:hypothetical protein
MTTLRTLIRPGRKAPALVGTLLLAGALALAGCGGSDDGTDDIASAGGAGASPSAAGSEAAKLSDEERRLKFAECMRGQGLDVPDPGEGGRDGVLFRLDENTDPKKVEAAMTACKAYAPNGGEPLKLDAEQLDKLREFSRCMRANGVPQFPDPDADGRIRLEKYAGLDRDDAAFKAATEKCRQYAPTGPGGPR